MPTTMETRIELQDVSFAYDGGGPMFTGVGCSVGAGEVLAIVAPVGEGKSTLLKVCAGILRPSRGQLIIDGRQFWNLSTIEQNDMRRRMGFNFQEAALIANMSISNNLALPLRYHGELSESKIRELIDEWLRRLGLVAYRDSLPAALSLGLRRRVSFIRAMLAGDDFFFWDEPTQEASVDFSDLVVQTVMDKKRQGAAQVMVTQNADLMKSAADRAIVIQGGKVRYYGPLREGGIPVDISADRR